MGEGRELGRGEGWGEGGGGSFVRLSREDKEHDI